MLKITIETMQGNASDTKCFKVVQEDVTKFGKTLSTVSKDIGVE